MKDKPHNEQSSIRQKFPYHTHPAQTAQLYFVATPLGNLGDITKRAVQILESCDEVWCEDTRHSQALLTALKMPPKRLRRVDQHISPAEIEQLLKVVSEKRQRIGIISDAGTPGVSDPGAKVIEAVGQFPEIKIIPIPGPSAITALMSISGVHENAFAFLGFFPREEKEAHVLLKKMSEDSLAQAFVFFESPNRILETIQVLQNWIDIISTSSVGEIRFVFVKEMTKIYETILMGSGKKFLHSIMHQHFDSPEKSRGEWCFLIDFSDLKLTIQKPLEDWAVTLECLISAGIPTKEAAALISQRFSIAKNLAYKKALELIPVVKKMKKNESKG